MEHLPGNAIPHLTLISGNAVTNQIRACRVVPPPAKDWVQDAVNGPVSEHSSDEPKLIAVPDIIDTIPVGHKARM